MGSPEPTLGLVREVTEVDLRLPSGRSARLTGDAGDTSVIGSIRNAGGEYESGLVQALAANVQKDWVCLDIGANVGPITLTLGELCGRGAVHAFEPVPVTFGYLETNISANVAGRNVQAHRLALRDEPGEVVIHFNPEFSGGAFVSSRLEHGESWSAPASTLDDWVTDKGIDRIDLIKIDVEGSELAVLDGAAETLRRFQPALVVELNPITIKRMGGVEPRDLYRRLAGLYGGRGHIASVPARGPMTPVLSWHHVERVLAKSGLTDLYCSPQRLVPGRSPGVATRREAATELLDSLRHWSRFGRPKWAALADPHILIRVDQLPTGRSGVVRGQPGERIFLPLLAYNRGRMTIVGDAPRFPVTTRVIWIDQEGHHIVDDRSRVTVPTMRPGGGASLRMPLFLPEEPGTYGLRVTFFQEDMCWFHDLDAESAVDVDVVVEH